MQSISYLTFDTGIAYSSYILSISQVSSTHQLQSQNIITWETYTYFQLRLTFLAQISSKAFTIFDQRFFFFFFFGGGGSKLGPLVLLDINK